MYGHLAGRVEARPLVAHYPVGGDGRVAAACAAVLADGSLREVELLRGGHRGGLQHAEVAGVDAARHLEVRGNEGFGR